MDIAQFSDKTSYDAIKGLTDKVKSMSIPEAIAYLSPWHYAYDIDGHLTGDPPPKVHPKLEQLIKAGAFKRQIYPRVLDLGSNAGQISIWFVDNKSSLVDAIEGGSKYYPQLEFVVEQLGYTDRIVPIYADITKIDFGHNEYDLVLLLGVLHHLPNSAWGSVLSRVYDAMLPGAELVVQTKSDIDVISLLANFVSVERLNTNWNDRDAWVCLKDPMKI